MTIFLFVCFNHWFYLFCCFQQVKFSRKDRWTVNPKLFTNCKSKSKIKAARRAVPKRLFASWSPMSTTTRQSSLNRKKLSWASAKSYPPARKWSASGLSIPMKETTPPLPIRSSSVIKTVISVSFRLFWFIPPLLKKERTNSIRSTYRKEERIRNSLLILTKKTKSQDCVWKHFKMEFVLDCFFFLFLSLFRSTC